MQNQRNAMQNQFEYTDRLNHPMEAFFHDAAPDNFPILPHWHYFVEIIHLKKGYTEMTCGDSVYVLRPGDMIVFCPQRVHSIDVLSGIDTPAGLQSDRRASDTKLFQKNARPRNNIEHHAIYPVPTDVAADKKLPSIHYEVLKFDLNYLQTNHRFKTHFSRALTYVFENSPKNIYFSADTLKTYGMDHLMEQCIYEMEFAKYGCDVANSSLIAILLTKMMRCWLSLGLPLNDIMWETISDHPAFEEIATYIDEHYNESLRVKDLANLFGMSYSYFSKLFRQTYNQSCKEYIEFTRLNHVLDLLRFTHLDLTYISQETGFSDCSHLIRTFKKWTGTTPMHWRKENGYR